MKLILGSTSPFRKELLQKLGLSFEVDSPDIDETMLQAEQPEEFVQRLALEKAQAVAAGTLRRAKDAMGFLAP